MDGKLFVNKALLYFQAMSHKKRSDLLSHPVCKTLLERKWLVAV